jgi:hypothetical protein
MLRNEAPTEASSDSPSLTACDRAGAPLPAEPSAVASPGVPGATRGWGLVARIAFRFLFLYWLLYSLSLILSFPVSLISSPIRLSAAQGSASAWWGSVLKYLGYPSSWYHEAMNRFTPWVSRALLGVEVQPPTQPTGSGDGLFSYCTCFAYLVLAVGGALAWTAASEAWWRLKTHRRPAYDRLHTLLRLILRFHLMYMMIVYGAIKIWCDQFPPINDAQLETKYGDSSPMGLLWRFMQFSQPYTSATGIIEFTCGLLLICRHTTLLGALCAAGATFQVFLLNMCYDVPVKLMSGHLLLMALTLIAPDAKRLLSFFVLGRPAPPRPLTPLFGSWKWLNRVGLLLRTGLFGAFAALTLYGAYQEARNRGILAPENPNLGRWVGKEFMREGKRIPFPPQPENPPLRQLKPAKWQGGPGMPAVIRVNVGPMWVSLMFEDGSGVGYLNVSNSPSELVLVTMKERRQVARLKVSLPEPELMILEGPFDGQEVRMPLRKVPTSKKEYPLRTRGFRWIQESPFNR